MPIGKEWMEFYPSRDRQQRQSGCPGWPLAFCWNYFETRYNYTGSLSGSRGQTPSDPVQTHPGYPRSSPSNQEKMLIIKYAFNIKASSFSFQDIFIIFTDSIFSIRKKFGFILKSQKNIKYTRFWSQNQLQRTHLFWPVLFFCCPYLNGAIKMTLKFQII